MEINPQVSVIVEKHLETLSNSGFAVSPFGGNTFAVDSFPKFLIEDQVNKVISKILDRSSIFGKDENVEEIIKEIAMTVAVFASIKPEQKLEMAEMECLLAQWETLGSPKKSMLDTPFLV